MKLDIAQLEFIDKKLRLVVVWLELELGVEFTGTSLVRFDDPGVHGLPEKGLKLRGLDLRMRSKHIGRNIEAMINDNWEYDPARPHKAVCMLHGKGANLHLHLQTHPNTRRKP